MQPDGIGRGGYRALALVVAAVGALGLVMAAVALAPSGFFEWLGLALLAIALVALAVMVLAVLGQGPASPRPQRPAPAGSPDEQAELVPEPPVPADPGTDLGFDYPDVEPLAPTDPNPQGPLTVVPPAPPRPARPLSTPPPMARPASRSAPPAGRADPHESGWPARAPKAGVTRGELARRARDPGPEIEIEGPSGPSSRRDPPIVMARTVASAEASGIPEGSTVGKCGNCGVLLLAPKKRPIRLQCPRCERVHTLG